ncbi:aminotransferase class IV [Dehalogenimonas sp. THU2]|uniref:aminotransferase class IV n=1 Tax=Dehalogenimonas sp. THU2 TaxID=3151121 RepID=UPI00321834EC
MLELAYVNGIITPLVEAKIHVADAGFRLGYGVFETMRGYDDRLFRLDRHLDRLYAGAAFLGVSIDRGEAEAAALRTLTESHLADARVRLTVTSGQAGESTTVITVEHYRPPAEEEYRLGLAAITSTVRRHTGSPLCRYKTLNQLENSLARTEAQRQGVAEAIILNERGDVTETNRANLFTVKGGILKTPGLDSGILPGITRSAVLELAARLGIEVIEGRLSPAELLEADEVFISSSLIEIMPLTVIDGMSVSDKNIGPVTTRLRRAYRSLVRVETDAGATPVSLT